MTIWLSPCELVEVMPTTPWISPSWRSRGAVMRLAIVSGPAPGNCVVTTIVGNSTSGKEETGSSI